MSRCLLAVLVRCDDPEPISYVMLLQKLLCQVLEIPAKEILQLSLLRASINHWAFTCSLLASQCLIADSFIIPDHVCICLLLFTNPMAPACFLQRGIEGHFYAQLLFR